MIGPNIAVSGMESIALQHFTGDGRSYLTLLPMG